MTYIKNGTKITIARGLDSTDTLPCKNYITLQDPQTGQYYLSELPKFNLPGRIYGNPEALADRYLNTYHDTNKNLGILLAGLKGTGKSLLAQMICIESKLPVILVTESFKGEGFKEFIGTIEDECIIFIDEFEKIFNTDEKQQSLLSILDGAFTSRKIFLLTSNSSEVSEFLTNRPGRIYYLKEYDSLDENIIEDIIDDLLVDKNQREALITALYSIGDVNIDMLITIIKEMNRYKETARESIFQLNVRPENTYYDVKGELIVDVINRNPGAVGFNSVVRKLTAVNFTCWDNPLSSGNLNIERYDTIADEQVRHNIIIDWDISNCTITRKDKSLVVTNKLNKKEYLTFTKKKSYRSWVI